MRISIKQAIAFFAAVVLAACSLLPKPFDPAKLNLYFNALEGHFMGSVEMQKDGETIFKRSLGYADLTDSIPTTEGTRYRIGSITKSFTSLMILMAAREGKLSLDDHLDKYFPDAQIPNAEKITIDNMLYHRSGIHNIVTEECDFQNWYTTPQTEEQILERIAKAGSDFEPGSQMSYSNSGYMLLAYILEHLYSKSYAELVDEKIVRPLGLTNTFNAVKTDPSRGDARSYDPIGGWQYAPESDPSANIGAGSIVSTPSDLIKFIKALRTDFFGKGIYDQMSEKIDGWGRGLFRYYYKIYDGMGHTGGIEGFHTVFGNIGNVDFAICSNALDTDINNILVTMLHAVFGTEYDIPDFGSYIKLPTEILEKHVGTYTSEQLNLDIEIRIEEGTLVSQATGQMAIPLQALADSSFVFNQANIKIKFDETNGSFTLFQNGGEFVFVKK